MDVDVTLCSELPTFGRRCFLENGGACSRGHSYPQAHASSPGEAGPCALGLKYAILPRFCRKLVKKQIAQPTECNGLYDLKQMLDSVAGIALPLKLSSFAENYRLKFNFGKCLLPHSTGENWHLRF